MIELNNLELDELECDELRVNHIEVDSVNGITKEELSCLKGATSNIQEQIDAINTGFDTIIAGWQ